MATQHNISIDQGSDFTIKFSIYHANGVLFDVSNFTANAGIKKEFTSTSFINFDSSISNNTITLTMPAERTANVKSGNYVYDVIVVSNDLVNTLRVVEGIAQLTPLVSSRSYD